MEEVHQLAITDQDNRIQAIQYENVGLKKIKDQQIAALQRRYVDHLRHPGKDNIIIIARKHRTSANDKYHNLLYYVHRIQRHKRYVKLGWRNRHFLDHQFAVKLVLIASMHSTGLKRKVM